ncbi:MAG: glycoside hydrolase family 92 protein [Rikenellaceae bacterium]|nr:glycoside hydrolase family 92 protein [Rikenellaceae bacterium]
MLRKLTLILFLIASVCIKAQAQSDNTQYVDPFIGTADYSATHPGAVVPHGMMAVVPFNVTGSELNRYDKDTRWWSTPYDIRNNYSVGFAHGALSGVGCPEMGAIITMATTGAMEADAALRGSTYSDEVAKPGYYATTYDRFNIRAEATATDRASVERYTFNEGGEANIIIDLGTALSNESGAMLRQVSATEVEGMRLLGTFCYTNQAVFPVYFVARISQPATKVRYWKRQPEMTGVEAAWSGDSGQYKIYESYSREIMGDDIGVCFSLGEVEPGTEVEVRVGISYVSIEGARRNLEAECGKRSFDDALLGAQRSWSNALGRIRVEGGSDADRTIFYTALYHALLHPNIVSDVDTKYPKMESGTVGSGYNRYTVFSLWDTYRNLHQLLTLVYPDRQSDMVRTMVDMSKEWGWLPRWELYGRETFTMEGDPAIPVIVDSYLKGIRDFDVEAAYAAMKRSATTPGKDNPIRRDIDPYIERGYIPVGVFAQDMSGDNSVSHALEYYVADNALATFAREMGDEEFARDMERRASGWRNYYSVKDGAMRPIDKSGEFVGDFDPAAGANFSNTIGFHEGSSWNYTFFVPHDIEGLIKVMGGGKKFVERLEWVFENGHYDPTNEPDIAYPYLFSRVKGYEYLTQEWVRRLLDENYTTEPDGLPGNDDTGTMSAWAVFSMMGIYPDCPGEPYYTITTPRFERVEMDTDYGTIVITTEGKGDHIRRNGVELGGKSINRFRISHEELMKAKELNLKLY